MSMYWAGSAPRTAQSRAPNRQWAAVIAALILTVCIAQQSAAQVTIFVTTTQQGVTNGLCSLQEAIYSSEFKLNTAVRSTAPDTFYPTRCVPGSGNGDTIVLPAGAVFTFDHFWDGDAHNAYGPTATPVIFSTVTIEGNGATLQWMDPAGPPRGNSRLFAVGRVDDPGFGVGTGNVVLRNVYVKGFHIKGGNGGSGGGGGLGAGGAIYVEGFLTVENSTFESNGAVGGNGASGLGEGGGGGLSGNGGDGCLGSGGGGGGSRGNGGQGECGVAVQGGGGGGGTVFSGGNATGGTGGSSGFHCGGNGGDAGNDGHKAACPGAGGGGGGDDTVAPPYREGDGAQGSYGGGGGGGGGDGGNGGIGGGGGGGGYGFFHVSGGDGGFGGGGGAAGNGFVFGSSPGKGGPFGGQADNNNGGGGGALGGAIFSNSSQLRVHNSTFFNNFVTRGVAGGGPTNSGDGASAGGAIFSYNDWPLEITNSTFSGNQSTGSGGAVVAYSYIPDAYGGPPIIFILNNTIIANNGANECFFRGTMNIGGIRNLIMNNGSGSGQFSACPGVVATSDPQLLPLELNSPGNTPTMAIFPSSPAFNSADPRTSLSTDQRGVPRPQLGGFDIGAFEARGDGR